MSFVELAEMITTDKGYSAFVVNCGKCPMEFTTKNIERIRSLLSSAGM